jgi:putative oxidoreductase
MLGRVGKDLGLLLLRIFSAGLMIFPHGWGKVMKLINNPAGFPDPLGIGATLSLSGAVFTEVICSLMIILGIKTRWFSVPALFTMLIAAFVVHANDPWKIKEKAILFSVMYLVLAISGGGKYSVRD